MIVAINYADEKFKTAQSYNTQSAYKIGKVDKVIEYSPKDLDKNFYKDNIEILEKKRGGGYWLWKPYIILNAMKEMNEGDYLFYCDSGAMYINKVQLLVDYLEKSKQSIMPFELPLIEKQWTQKTTFKLLKCNSNRYKDTNQILATYMLIKVNKESVKFIQEYLKYCRNKDILIDNELDENEDEDYQFIAHRHDQSIFSLLCKKYNYKTFRDPSQYGIRPWEYLANNRLYRENKHIDCKYPQIIVSFRKENPKKYRKKDKIKYLLTKFKILNRKQFIKRNKIKNIIYMK